MRRSAPGASLLLLAGVGAFAWAPPVVAQTVVRSGATTTEAAASRGWLGINVTVIRHAGEATDRILVTDVWQGGPALEAGLRSGDQILRVNGTPVSGDRFRSLTRRLEPGDPLSLLVLREGRELEIMLVAGERPDPTELVPRELQEELDAVRGRLSRILEESRVRMVASDGQDSTVRLAVPSIVVERIQGDSIRTRVFFEGDSIESRVRVHSVPKGAVERALYDTSTRPDAPVPFTVWVQAGDSVEGRAVRTVLRLEQADAGESPKAAQRVSVVTADAPAPADVSVTVEAPVRPLAPYLAGVNRVAGAEMRAVTPSLAPFFGVESGVLVTLVEEATPAGRAGLRAGDVIQEVNGIQVESVPVLRELLARFRTGITLQIVRKGSRVQVELR